jgi:hypothetical protein
MGADPKSNMPLGGVTTMLKALIAAPVGLALLAGIAMTGLSVSAASAANKYTCMTDDGYGRKRPCSAGYKAANPQWRAGDSCFTDEGNGRFRPCSAGYKAKHAK